MPGAAIVVEITESVLLNASDEVDRQLQAYRDAGCHYGQGYLFSHSLPPEKFEALLLQAGAGIPAEQILAQRELIGL